MFSPRWRKVLRDLWSFKWRTLLVALSIAVGVFAVGVVTQTFGAVRNQLVVEYPKSNPASATLITSPFDDDLLQSIRKMDGIAHAEGRGITVVQVRVGNDEWRQMELFAIPDFKNININKVYPQPNFPPDSTIGAERGIWPPTERGVLIERASFLLPGMLPAGLKVGDSFEVKAPNNRIYQLNFQGLAHEPGRIPPTFVSAAYGYITLDTLEWLTGTRQMDELDITVSRNALDQKYITQVAEQVKNKVETGGGVVGSLQVPIPGRHPFEDLFQGLLLLLNALGLSSLFLSGFLIVNTISALLGQQVRQIGVMKAIGARNGQIVGMYLVMTLIYGILAFLIAAPSSAFVAGRTSQLLAGFINVDFPQFQFVPDIIILEAIIAIVFPLIIGIFPVLAGTRMTVREAISDYGISTKPSKQKAGSRKRFFPSFNLQPSSFLSRPLMLSLRNTFRRKGRLALTLLTLTLAGAIFMSVFSVHSAMLITLEDALKYWKFDVMVIFNRAYPSDLIEQEVQKIPGITHAEGWGMATVRRLRPDDSESPDLMMFATPTNTTMIEPTMIQGRWLLPDDENAIVISNAVAKLEPDIKVGDDITLKINGKKSSWHVVGVDRVVGNFGGAGNVNVNLPYFERVTGLVGRSIMVQVTTDRHDRAYQDQIQKAITDEFKQAGIRVGNGMTSGLIREQNETFFNIIIGLLLVMTVLMAFVGGLGLMGTMTLNVIERTREIGVMRAIGASNGAIQRIVIVEGVLIGAVSWLVGAVVAIPLGQMLSAVLGEALLQLPLHYVVSTDGIVLWFIVVLVISALASILPAHNASRLTVRQVLAYE